MAKWTASDIPDQNGRTAIVTGANSGLGYQTAAALAVRGAHVVLAVRDLDKGEKAATRIAAVSPRASVTVTELDLASLISIRNAAARLTSHHDHIDLLVNNAGVMYPPKQSTADGFETQFGTNHLGPFAFTGLILERMMHVAGSRVVTVSSNGHEYRAAIHFDDLNWERGYDPVDAYGQSKLANMLFTYELQRRLAGTHTSALAAHPGFANTEGTRELLTRRLPRIPGVERTVVAAASVFAQGPRRGALPILRAATDPAALGGQYYGPRGFLEMRGYPKVVPSSAESRDPELQRRLWAVSEDLTGVAFPVG